MSSATLEQFLGAQTANESSPSSAAIQQVGGALTGILVGLVDSVTPLVTYPGQPGTAAIRARSITDLHAAHVGRQVMLIFDRGNPQAPIILGCLREERERLAPEETGQIEVDADGQRMIVSVKEQLVLRCGQASITLTRAGKVLIQGNYVCSRSSGVNRIKGGSVQIN